MAEASAPSGKDKLGPLQGAASAKASELLQATEQRLGEVERELAAARAAIGAAEQRLQVLNEPPTTQPSYPVSR